MVCVQANTSSVPGGAGQFVLKLCCHGSIARVPRLCRLRIPQEHLCCAAVGYLKADSDLLRAQKESSCKET